MNIFIFLSRLLPCNSLALQINWLNKASPLFIYSSLLAESRNRTQYEYIHIIAKWYINTTI